MPKVELHTRGAVMCLLAAALLLSSAKDVPSIAFEDVTKGSGLQFVLRNSATPQKHQIETMPGGVAVLDYDNDRKLDLYFTNGAPQPQLTKSGPGWFNRLYRNNGEWQFEDVTEKAGVHGEGYTFGVATGDYNNDGFADLFVAGLHRNILYWNRGDGTFEDVTTNAGLTHAAGLWSIAAGWFDYDNDGRLDLFVVNYVRWDPAKETFCGDPKGEYRTYCHPKFYQGLPNILYRNNGDGTFTDVSAISGIAQHVGKGMGIAFADYDTDGDQDVFVANDTVPNFLFLNEGNGRFAQVSLQAGVAFNDDGRALSSMGVDFRDVDNDGLPDLFVTALANETYPLYRNLGGGVFSDITYPSRLGAATMPLSGWGNGIYDFNNDGHKDLFAANSDVQDNTELFSSRKSRLSNTVFRNQADGTFAPQFIGIPSSHRGAAFADFDEDGRTDAVVTRMNEPAVLLRNVSGANNWIGFHLKGRSSNRDAIGARIRIVTKEGEQWNHVATSVGYASSSSKAVHFGLGKAAELQSVEIIWPSGIRQELKNVKAGQYLQVTEPQSAPAGRALPHGPALP